MSNETGNFSNHERDLNGREPKTISAERHSEPANEREHDAAERQHERVSDARKSLERISAKAEKESRRIEKSAEHPPAERRGPASKRERSASFDTTMQEVRSQMSSPSRAFSRFIHSPIVDKVSDVVGGTIARPNAIASGAVAAFLVTLAIYLVARFFGYPLSGAETIASFVAGWILGIVYDYLRLIILGKK